MEKNYRKMIDEIQEVGVRTTQDSREHYETIFQALSSSNDDGIRQYALQTFKSLVSQRNTGLALPERIWSLLKDSERRDIEEFRVRLKKISDRASIEKFPNLYFEFEDIFEFCTQYFEPKCPPFIGRNTKIVTIGSCFANNIANHLQKHGFEAKTTGLAELANNSYTNLAIAQSLRDESKFHTMADHFKIQKEDYHSFRDSTLEADVFIFTVGISYAFFHKESGNPLCSPVISYNKSFYKDYEMRPMDVTRNANNMLEIIQAFNAIRPNARIIMTLSPVPMDGCAGLNTSVVEADCISKSIGRASLALVEDHLRKIGYNRFVYFPAFEIVRWVACNQAHPLFGGSDHHSRHVTDSVIETIMNVFSRFYCLDRI